IDVPGIDAGVEGALRQLHLGRDLRDRPAAPTVLGVDHGAEIARPVAALAVRELQTEDVPGRARLRRGPRGAPVGAAVDDALLARDPWGPRIHAGDGAERPLRARILPLPGLGPIRGVEDTAELADHPSLAIGRETGGEQSLADLTQRDRRGASGGGR